jgi:hypothetical protein
VLFDFIAKPIARSSSGANERQVSVAVSRTSCLVLGNIIISVVGLPATGSEQFLFR